MPKRGENIHKRKDGRWEGRIKPKAGDSSKALYKSIYGKTYGEVKKKLAEHAESDKHESNRKSVSFRDAAALWLQTGKHKHKGATEVKYENLLNKHILPSLGDYRLSSINTVVLTEFMNNKLTAGRLDGNGGLSPSYVRSIMLVVTEILAFATEEQLCEPSRIKIRKPAVEKKELEILDHSSQQKLEAVLLQDTDEVKAGILLSLYTGLRISEVCALKWSDIDLRNKVIHVRSTVARVKDTSPYDAVTKLIIDRPKTKSSKRDIPVSSFLLPILTSLYKGRRSEYVISDTSSFVSPRTYEYRFHKILRACDAPSINYHALRHPYVKHTTKNKSLQKQKSQAINRF